MADVVLDSQGLSLWIDDDRYLGSIIKTARQDRARIVTCANTIIEVTHPKVDRARLRWLQSQLVVEPVTKHSAALAADLLVRAGMHGHQHALDATLVQTALGCTGPVSVITSDESDLRRLAGDEAHRIRFISV